MAAYRLPAIDHVPKLSHDELCTLLDQLFEPSPELCQLCAPLLQLNSFSSYQDLILSIKSELDKLLVSKGSEDQQILDKILGSHPRLGENKPLGEQSQAEQAQLQSSDQTEAQRLKEMNSKYEETFPGLRYVVFVDGRSRGAILDDMQARIDRDDGHEERRSAIDAICAIAADRSRKLVAT